MDITDLIIDDNKKKTLPNQIGNFIAHYYLENGGRSIEDIKQVDFKKLAVEYFEHPSFKYYGIEHFDKRLTKDCIYYAVSCFMERRFPKHLEKYYGNKVEFLEPKKYLTPFTAKQRGFIWSLLPNKDNVHLLFEFFSRGQAGKLITCLQEKSNIPDDLSSKVYVNGTESLNEFLERYK